jgi:hypothetical protein
MTYEFAHAAAHVMLPMHAVYLLTMLLVTYRIGARLTTWLKIIAALVVICGLTLLAINAQDGPALMAMIGAQLLALLRWGVWLCKSRPNWNAVIATPAHDRLGSGKKSIVIWRNK